MKPSILIASLALCSVSSASPLSYIQSLFHRAINYSPDPAPYEAPHFKRSGFANDTTTTLTSTRFETLYATITVVPPATSTSASQVTEVSTIVTPEIKTIYVTGSDGKSTPVSTVVDVTSTIDVTYTLFKTITTQATATATGEDQAQVVTVPYDEAEDALASIAAEGATAHFNGKYVFDATQTLTVTVALQETSTPVETVVVETSTGSVTTERVTYTLYSTYTPLQTQTLTVTKIQTRTASATSSKKGFVVKNAYLNDTAAYQTDDLATATPTEEPVFYSTQTLVTASTITATQTRTLTATIVRTVTSTQSDGSPAAVETVTNPYVYVTTETVTSTPTSTIVQTLTLTRTATLVLSTSVSSTPEVYTVTVTPTTDASAASESAAADVSQEPITITTTVYAPVSETLTQTKYITLTVSKTLTASDSLATGSAWNNGTATATQIVYRHRHALRH